MLEQTHGIRLHAKFCHLLDFRILWCHQLAAISESWTRTHHYKPSPIQRNQNRFCNPTPSWQNLAHKLRRSKVWRINRQAHKNSTFLAAPEVGDIQVPPNLARWQKISSTFLHLKNVWVRRIVSPLPGAENLGETRPPQLKNPHNSATLQQVHPNFNS